MTRMRSMLPLLLLLAYQSAGAPSFAPGDLDPQPVLQAAARAIGTANLKCVTVAGTGYAGAVGQQFWSDRNVDWPRGEPLANYEPTWAAVERFHTDLGLSARHLTVSTVGIVPGIRRLATEALPVNLAVSLHAADDELRDQLVPINRRYPLSTLMDACAGYLQAKGKGKAKQ